VFIVNTITRIHSIYFMFCDCDEICECLKALLIVLISFIVVTVLTINIVSILFHMFVFIHTSCIDLCHYQKMVHNGPPMHNLSTMLVLLTTDFSQLYSVKIPLYCGMTHNSYYNIHVIYYTCYEVVHMNAISNNIHILGKGEAERKLFVTDLVLCI